MSDIPDTTVNALAGVMPASPMRFDARPAQDAERIHDGAVG